MFSSSFRICWFISIIPKFQSQSRSRATFTRFQYIVIIFDKDSFFMMNYYISQLLTFSSEKNNKNETITRNESRQKTLDRAVDFREPKHSLNCVILWCNVVQSLVRCITMDLYFHPIDLSFLCRHPWKFNWISVSKRDFERFIICVTILSCFSFFS